MKPSLPWLIVAAAVGLIAILFLRRKSLPGAVGFAASASAVVGADGRTYRRTYAGSDTQAQLWQPDPPDGFEYTPDLTWQLGQTTAPPIFRRFV